MATATVTGGNNVSLSLSGTDLVTAKNALAALSSQFASSSVQGIPLFPGSPTVLDVLNVDSRYTHNINATPDLDAIVVTGGEGTKITGNSTVQLIAGGRGADTINAAGAANVTITGGGGGDRIQLANNGQAGGNAYISLSSGNDTVRMWGGNATIVGSRVGDEIELNGGTNNVVVDKSANFDINGGNNTIVTQGGKFTVTGAGDNDITVTGRSVDIVKSGPSTLDLTLNSTVGGSYDLKGDMTIHQLGAGHHDLELSGNDTVYLGAGNVDITNSKGTTVFGGSGRLNFEGGGHGNDSIMAGSGSATILGGGGFDTIIGGSGAMKADGGDGKDLLIGGTFKDTLTGGAGGDSFRFVKTGSASSATHVITDFTHGMDKIDLSGGGYTMADITSATIKAGSTIIKLSDGTQITLKNFTNLSASDFT